MRTRWLSIAGVVCALALMAPIAAPAAAADDNSAQIEAAAPSDEASAPPEAASEPAKKAEKPKLICKTEPTTGSAIPHRTCRTPHQVEAQREAAKGNIDSLNDAQSGRTTGGGG
jgi:hypothetical protein